jgi:phospholipid-binding lipoprotein MlaA
VFSKLTINVLMLFLIICGLSNSKAIAAVQSKNEDYSYNYAELNNRCQVYDPYEPLNRKIFFVNGVLDTFILRPVTKWYGKVTNIYTKERVKSFVNNISEPLSMVNYGLQGKPDGAFKAFWRFAINSTLGVAGIFDVAEKIGLTAPKQTFSNTLGHYGVGSGPYIVLPVFGGMGVRDLMDNLLLDNLLNPIKTDFVPSKYTLSSKVKNLVTGARIIYKRNKIMPFTDHVAQNSPDPYITMRDAVIQEKEAKMNYPKGFKCPRVER